MFSDSYLSVSQNASISLTRTSVSITKTETSIITSNISDKDEEEVINLNVAANMAERLKEADSPEELISFMKEGQKEALEALRKFNELADKRLFGENEKSLQDYNDIMFDSVLSVVEDLLKEQSVAQVTKTEVNVSVEVVELSFEAKLFMAIRERDPEFADKLEEGPIPLRL